MVPDVKHSIAVPVTETMVVAATMKNGLMVPDDKECQSFSLLYGHGVINGWDCFIGEQLASWYRGSLYCERYDVVCTNVVSEESRRESCYNEAPCGLPEPVAPGSAFERQWIQEHLGY